MDNQTAAVLDAQFVAAYRRKHPEAVEWASGYGPITHTIETQARVFRMVEALEREDVRGDGVPPFALLRAADRLTSAAMWLVVHDTYATHVYLDGRDLHGEDFKRDPQGHTGGSLNMVPAYCGYLAINALTGVTRSWLMGQGHCVSAIDAVNLLVGNSEPEHRERYPLTDEGLSRYVQDFYSYALGPGGEQASLRGSHVNVYTAGGVLEGGYLGFAELQYVHMPLPGERLVAFLSDGAFEEQRGSDWAARWWRADDSGLAMPIMINNGRRIDQRTTMAQEGGTAWFEQHLRLNSFDPIVIDGTDPAAFAWLIWEMERRLQAAGEAAQRGAGYPVRLPYGIAVALKGAGFYNAGTNLAHNLPLPGNPRTDPDVARIFNDSARKLWVPRAELDDAIALFQRHATSSRVRERDHPIAHRDVRLREQPETLARPVPVDRRDRATWTRTSPMHAIDATFLATVRANPHLRPRVGNPDEMRSNRMQSTLDALKFRVTAPEAGVPEDVHGAVVTALNEEAVCCAALGNKGGLNIVVTYEAFAVKMLGALRQEITWSAQHLAAGRPQRWLSIPVVLTSHAWENGKNQESHQHPTLCEALMGELAHVSRVVFPADYTTAAATLRATYNSQGQIWALVVPKSDSIPDLFTVEEAERLVRDGALLLDWTSHGDDSVLVLTAIGAYQLEQVLRASERLRERDIAHRVVYMLEPGRFRLPRTPHEAEHQAPDDLRRALYPPSARARVFVGHCRPEPLLGVLAPLHAETERTLALGFRDRGGTLDVAGMLAANSCTWAHVLQAAACALDVPRDRLLTAEEIAALDGQADIRATLFAS